MLTVGWPGLRSTGFTVAALLTATVAPEKCLAESANLLDVVIDCMRLDAEARAELEARVRADMAARQKTAGTVSVVCGSVRAMIEWQPVSGTATSRTIELPEDPATLNERVLEVLADLTAANRPRAVGSSGRTLPNLENAPDRRNEREAHRGHDAGEIEEREPAHEAVPSIHDERARPSHATERKATTRNRGVLVAGAVGEAWSGDVALALGARGGICFETAWPDACVTFSGLRGLGLSEGLGATLFDLALGLDLPLEHRRQFWLGAGVAGLILIVSARSDLEPQSQSALSAAASLRARHVLAFGDWSLRYGPELRLDSNPLIARIDNTEAFRVPLLSLGVGIEIGFAP